MDVPKVKILAFQCIYIFLNDLNFNLNWTKNLSYINRVFNNKSVREKS